MAPCGCRARAHQPVYRVPDPPHVIGKDLEMAYRQMAQDEAREAEALAWAEATLGDVAEAC